MNDFIFLDCEVYPNFILVGCLDNENNFSYSILNSNNILYSNKPLELKNNIIGYNLYNYDKFILNALLNNLSIDIIYKISCSIIRKENNFILNNYPFLYKDIPNVTLIDLYKLIPFGYQGSLKECGARLHIHSLKELPYHPDTFLTKSQCDNVIEYCKNDLYITKKIYYEIKDKINTRYDIYKKYSNVFLTANEVFNKTEPSIAEKILIKSTSSITSTTNVPNLYKSYLSKLKFKDSNLIYIRDNLLCLNKLTKDNVNYILSKFKDGIKIDNNIYKVGLGGLHSSEINKFYKEPIIDSDIESFYPNIILNLQLCPKNIGSSFFIAYKQLLLQRLLYKHSNSPDKKENNNILKLIINSIYGKLGSYHSPFYCINTLLQVTTFGQLLLLYIVELLTYKHNAKVFSVNTDGILHNCNSNEIFDYINKVFNFNFQHKKINKIFIKDINNYFALLYDNTVKTKGIFAKRSIIKTPRAEIINEAVLNSVLFNIPIKKYIMQCKDLTKFIKVRKCKEGCIYNNQYIGKVVRWYYTLNGNNILTINGSQVAEANNVEPILDLKDFDWNKVDYKRYIIEALKLRYQGNNKLIKSILNTKYDRFYFKHINLGA